MQIIHNGNVVVTHLRIQRGRATILDHYPPEKIAFHQKTPTWCRDAALDIGPACVEVIAGLLAENVLFRLRAAQGVLGLRHKYGQACLEAACDPAIRDGDPSYRTIKGLLSAQT
ncbi:hypothetical protein [Kineosporia sp. NBRC 101677]|uniref:hypothetical protein n=1 Tax=Kineosporia sp. NBRC 101677 TaxID=3032197 RepID=UPI002556220C|nr:hypothetical protein [Kineosporia sp. NBRC 101677]